MAIISSFLSTNNYNIAIKYNFKYVPYTEENCPDPNLYNSIFNDVRETFMYIITNTYLETGEMMGVMLEVGVSGYSAQFNTLVSGKPLFGWRLFMFDVSPLTSDEISGISKGETSGNLKNPPTARYYVKLGQDNATVYIRYIMPALHNYDYINTYKVLNGKWTLMTADSVGDLKFKK